MAALDHMVRSQRRKLAALLTGYAVFTASLLAWLIAS